MSKIFKHIIYFSRGAILVVMGMLAGCEKEITVDLPKSTQEYVVEASVNQRFQSLNYVFISKSVDYFNPDLTLGGIKGATVYITEGMINGKDTIYNGTKTTMIDIATIPGADTLLKGLSGIYFDINSTLKGKENTSYLLEITLADGTKITGKTTIPKVVPVDSVTYIIKNEDTDHDGFNDAYATLFFTDPPEQNNYRLTLHKKNAPDSNMLGWGSADQFRTFDDQMLNGVPRFVYYNRPFAQGDTMNFYFNSIGRKEYLFWLSFGSASNNGGPFATPVQLKSNITGAIGSFTGYGCSYYRIILK